MSGNEFKSSNLHFNHCFFPWLRYVLDLKISMKPGQWLGELQWMCNHDVYYAIIY